MDKHNAMCAMVGKQGCVGILLLSCFVFGEFMQVRGIISFV